VKSLYAYAFTTALAPAELFARLRAAGPWQWIDRDSDRWGDYVSSSGVPGTIVKIIPGEPAPGQWTANVRFESDAGDADAAAARIRDTLLRVVLPAIGAQGVTETEYLE
jgi:hypothetical protein